MASVFPFEPYRYAKAAGNLSDLVTQPYDKITRAMQVAYLSRSPYNLVRIILGQQFPSDTQSNNVYTRAAGCLNDWIAKGAIQQDAEPAFYAYFQEFSVPDSAEKLTRKGFIGLGAVEDYAAGVVHRHERTLSGPKKDRLELLRHTHAHFGQIFMLYPDPEGVVDRVLDEAAQSPPLVSVTDDYEVVHCLWRISDSQKIAEIKRHMAPRKLLIADGHHRYETALAFRDENRHLVDARKVMMTFVNMYSPGLRILATHRLVSALGDSVLHSLEERLRSLFRVERLPSLADLKKRWSSPAPGKIRIGVARASSAELLHLEADRGPGQLDVPVVHDVLLERLLGIGEEAVREEKHLRYARGLEAAVEEVRKGAVQFALLLEPTTVQQVAEVSFSGGVMPQKSTDFYPKLLSGLTIYKLRQ